MKNFTSRMFFLSLIITCLNIQIYGQNKNREFRSAWVITWEYISPSSTIDQNKARIREILDNIKKANMTSVLFQVRQSGTVYFQSSYEPYGYYAGYKYPGFDPLAYAIEEAHKRGLELHAWFNVFSVASTQPGTIASEHPEWICRDQSGNPMTSNLAASPGLLEVREYTINVAMELIRNYDVDGLHLDYIRWNEYDTDDMQSPATKIEQEIKLDGNISNEKLNKIASGILASRFLYDINHPYSAGIPAGFSTWEDWWRWSVTEFVRVLHDSIQSVKPWIRLSPAALGKYKDGGIYGWNGYYVVYQDAALWFNEGYVDQLTPMHYHWLTGNDLFNAITSDWEPYIQTGINAGRLYSCGPPSYRLDENNVWSNHEGIVNRLRDKSWVDGFQFFSYGSWRDYNYWEEAASKFFNSKMKIRDSYKNTKPLPPSLQITKLDSLSYIIKVTPHGGSVNYINIFYSLSYIIKVTPDQSISKDYWFAIYRSEDEILDVDNDAIVNIHFGKTENQFTDYFTGLQDFNGSYKYFATILNRFWNESDISNSDSTLVIPSFAPVVTSTLPAEQGTIKINDKLILKFSKTMDSTSFHQAISFTPAISAFSLSWSTDLKELTITAEGFSFGSFYSLRIEADVTDINSRYLDGNNDGIEGDPFILNFSVEVEDNSGPEILSSYPENNSVGIDVASIISVEFDEALSSQSLSSNSIKLMKDGSTVNFSMNHTKTVDGRSILCIQPAQLFETEKNYELLLNSDISDTLGNKLSQDVSINFSTSSFAYIEIKMIENFTNPGDWKQPSYSGSTKGIIVSETSFDYSTSICPPITTPYKSGRLTYAWDVNASDFLIREYLAGGIPQAIYFDTSYVLQCYVFGDGSKSALRFCIDEYQGGVWGDHEVSDWIFVDWNGWKLVEWQLNDPTSVGIWIGDGLLTGSYFRIDSYQLTKLTHSDNHGEIFFDELRAVKKIKTLTNVQEISTLNLKEFILYQNYPNPFNPSTKIKFEIPASTLNPFSKGEGTLVQLKVYDVLGNEVATLVNEYKPAGSYEVEFNVAHESLRSSGVYFYQIKAGEYLETKKMILIK